MLIPDPAVAATRPAKVLLLEDSEHQAGLIFQALQRAGFDATPRRITSAAALIAALDDDKWDAVVCQFQMPRLNGFDALRIVRATGLDIPFIFICETMADEAALPAIQSGANHCIEKANLALLAPALSGEIVYAKQRAKSKMTHHNLIAADNLARQHIQGRLTDSELAWRLMFDSNPVAQMLNLPFSAITSVNDRLVELIGYERNELVGRTIDEIGLRVDDELGRQFLASMKTHGQADGLDLRVRRRDGNILQVLVSTRTIVLEGTAYRLHSFVDVTAHRQAEEQARLSQQALASIFQGVLISGPDRLTLSVNQAFEALTGYSQDELIGQTCAILQGPKTSAETVRQIRCAVDAGQPFVGELLNYRKDGTTFWNALSINPVFGSDGQLKHFVGVQRDITEHKTQQAQIRLAAQVFAQGHEGIVVTDANRLIVLVNDTFTAISGYTQAETLGKNLHVFASERQGNAQYLEIWQTVDTHGKWQGEVWNRRKDGAEYPVWLTISAVRGDLDEICNYVCTSRDTSEQQAAREQIVRLSHFDMLTGLANRVLLADRSAHDISVALRAGGPVAMIMLGLDNFNTVNDTLGHALGDQVLKQFAQRIAAASRDQDMVARVGDQEFVLVLPGNTPEGAGMLATKLLQLVAQPHQINNTEIRITASIGIAIFPTDGLDFETLFKSAEIAMHHARELGRQKYRFYSAEMFESTKAQVTLVSGLRTAAAQNQLQLHYQPFVDMLTGRVTGMEALLRWNHPELGEVSPARFIPVAEQSGLIVDIGAWVLRRSCQDLRDWLDRGIDVPQVSLNVSPVQLRDAEFLKLVEATLREFSIEPHRISVEVTEGALMEDVAHSETLLRSLKAMGVQLALDDFGTGYSSLSYLKLFPFDKVKIDKSFVCDINKSAQDAVITKVIISMAHGLGLRVIAEGVETEAQCEFMRANMCDEIQGYFFSRAVPKDAMEALLVTDRHLPAHLLRVQSKVRTLLLVDDEPNVISSLKRLMRRDGYHILSAGSAQEGLELLSRNPVEVIVTDQRIPGMTGVEFLNRAKAIYPDTIRIVLSVYAELQAVTSAINEGTVYRFLTKPWDGEQLRSFIKEAFDHKELADENRQLNLKVLTANQDLARCMRQIRDMREFPRDEQEEAETI